MDILDALKSICIFNTSMRRNSNHIHLLTAVPREQKKIHFLHWNIVNQSLFRGGGKHVIIINLINLINLTSLYNMTNQAKEVAERHKLTLIDQIGDLEDHFLFEAPHVSKR